VPPFVRVLIGEDRIKEAITARLAEAVRKGTSGFVKNHAGNGFTPEERAP